VFAISLYTAVTNGWVEIAAVCGVGVVVFGLALWAVTRHWILLAIPVVIVPMPLFVGGLDVLGSLLVFSSFTVLIASVIDLFEVQGEKLRHSNGGRP
jgi:hypothetical protein